MRIKERILKTSVLLFLVFLTLLSISQTFAYWASSVTGNNTTAQGTINIGTWSTMTQEEETVSDFELFLNELLDPASTYYDPDAAAIYDTTKVVDGATVTFNSILLEGHDWDILGTGEIPVNGKAPRIGFIQLVDRSLNTSGIPVHPILPPAPGDSDANYPDYSYFAVNDISNNLTSNHYSIRLNYEVQMTLSEPLNNVTNISFYALRSLYVTAYPDNDPHPYNRTDDYPLASSRSFIVSVSSDGVNFTSIGTGVPGTSTSLSANFNFYSYAIPSQFLNQPLYVRIYYNGATLKNRGTVDYSRLIIDELTITHDN
jgi:hypothetical protein